MLYALLALIALVFATPANAQVHVDIGIHLPAPPPLVVVPGVASVQYAPSAPANVFFYSNQYWIFANGGFACVGFVGLVLVLSFMTLRISPQRHRDTGEESTAPAFRRAVTATHGAI